MSSVLGAISNVFVLPLALLQCIGLHARLYNICKLPHHRRTDILFEKEDVLYLYHIGRIGQEPVEESSNATRSKILPALLIEPLASEHVETGDNVSKPVV